MAASFEHLDSKLKAFAQTKKLSVYTRYKDEEVRCIDIVDEKGNKYQMWIEPGEGSEFEIHVWDYANKRGVIKSLRVDFAMKLEKAYQLVLNWINTANKARM